MMPFVLPGPELNGPGQRKYKQRLLEDCALNVYLTVGRKRKKDVP